MSTEPKLVLSPNTGKYYIVTKYRAAGNGIHANQKIDVSEQIEALITKGSLKELEDIYNPWYYNPATKIVEDADEHTISKEIQNRIAELKKELDTNHE